MRMLTTVAIWLVAASSFASVRALPQEPADERAITQLIADRQAAWNAGDPKAYGRLLTDDADISSATGRTARGRNAVVHLYEVQRAGAYAGASTRTSVMQIRFIRPDVAVVDADFENSGLRDSSAPSKGKIFFVVVKQSEWLIAAIRGIPASPPQP